MQRILTVNGMRECEAAADKNGVSLASLMDNAAEGLFCEVMRVYQKHYNTGKITILAGKGNNGGDGIVLARLLSEAGVRTSLLLVCGQPATPLSKAAFEKLPENVLVYNLPFDKALEETKSCDILIDCVFGTGFSGEIKGSAVPVFEAANASKAYKIACDIPSGCDAQTGLCSKLSFNADMTVTFHRKKLGYALSPARELCGDIKVCDIGIDESLENRREVITEYERADLAGLLPKRPAYGHKGTFGRVLCITGCENYIGAAAMSALAAMRCGAGLVTVATEPYVISALAGGLYECTFLPVKDYTTDEISCALKSADAVLIGCGLSINESRKQLLKDIIRTSQVPVVIDADGLNMLSCDIKMLEGHSNDIILTPHIGELARLCGVDNDRAVKQRSTLAAALSEKYNVTVVSKSAETLIFSGGKNILTRFGNTALAKGGSGDMLSGMAASFLAQGADVTSAAVLACGVLGLSAQRLCESGMSPRGVLARDILCEIPRTLSDIEE